MFEKITHYLIPETTIGFQSHNSASWIKISVFWTSKTLLAALRVWPKIFYRNPIRNQAQVPCTQDLVNAFVPGICKQSWEQSASLFVIEWRDSGFLSLASSFLPLRPKLETSELPRVRSPFLQRTPTVVELYLHLNEHFCGRIVSL